jgi:excisionase family DNA binding protein
MRRQVYGVLMSTKRTQGVLLKPGEVAFMFGVDPKTVTRWAKEGKIPSIRTPGGHRRYFEEDVMDLRERQAVK